MMSFRATVHLRTVPFRYVPISTSGLPRICSTLPPRQNSLRGAGPETWVERSDQTDLHDEPVVERGRLKPED